jgi:hypothetical protein
MLNEYEMKHTIIIGEKCDIVLLEEPPSPVKAERLIINVPCPGFLMIKKIKVNGEDMLIGDTSDGYVFIPLAMEGCRYAFPIMDRIELHMIYTGLIPKEFASCQSYKLIMLFTR